MTEEGRDIARALVVEDDPVLRSEIVQILATADDFEVVADFGTGAEGLAFAGEVELAVIDLGLPDTTGADLIRELKTARPTLEVMVHTVQEDRAAVFDAIVAGASSYVLKGTAPEQLLAWMREFRAGGSPMSPRIAREVLGAFRRQGTVAARYELSPREREILAQLEEGLSYKEVGARIHLSTHTVHTHIKRIYEKLQVTSKAEALTKARLRGMI